MGTTSFLAYKMTVTSGEKYTMNILTPEISMTCFAMWTVTSHMGTENQKYDFTDIPPRQLEHFCWVIHQKETSKGKFRITAGTNVRL